MQVQTTTIDVPTSAGSADAVLAVPDAGGPRPGVLVFMDAFGLRPRIEEMATTLAESGYVVLVPNLFHRAGRAPVVELGDLTDPALRSAAFDKLGPLMRRLTPELAVRDAGDYLDFLAADDRVCDAPVGLVGYCMGGALALRTAAAQPDRVAAVASFHGGRLATDAPDSPHLLVDRIRAEVYVGHADHDHSMPREQQARLEETLAASGLPYATELYEGAPHGFTMADTAAYDEAATARHWERLTALFARTLSC